jgi:hypothetical protein
MVWWRDVEVWTVAEGPNSRARKLACPPRGHRVTVALPHILGGLGMSGGLGTPPVGVRKKNTTEESHEETELSSNMN